MLRLRCIVVIIFTALSALACNAPFMASSSTAVPTQINSVPTGDSATQPRIAIEAPGDGAQAVIGEPFSVRIHATDGVGITRVGSVIS